MRFLFSFHKRSALISNLACIENGKCSSLTDSRNVSKYPSEVIAPIMYISMFSRRQQAKRTMMRVAHVRRLAVALKMPVIGAAVPHFDEASPPIAAVFHRDFL